MVDRDGNELSRDTESTPTGGPIDSPNIELLRDDLIELLDGTIQSTTEFIFDDSIATLQDDGAAVEVTFVRSGTRTFDFLIGADGLHSNVRRKVFGPEEQFIKRLGTYAAIFTVPNFLELDYWQKWHYGDNTMAGVYSARDNSEARAALGFMDTELQIDYRDTEAQFAELERRMIEDGWVRAQLLHYMRSAPDFYFDEMAQIVMDSWAKGRVALVGDAAYCCSPLSGQGTSVAVLGAYILAGELAAAGNDYQRGFANYHAEFSGFGERNQWLVTDNIPGGEPIPEEAFERIVNSLELEDYRQADRIGGKVRAAVSVVGSVRLSVLDLVPVRTDQSTRDALAATVSLAQTAERLGFTRYWVAEHHNMASVGATSPPVLIAYLAAQTTHLRLGSGGVMLPNHAPLAVAEQFALLEAAAPGRIDLGIGRAPGSDPVTSYALRGGRSPAQQERDIESFPDYLDDVVALMSARGARVPLQSGDYILKATSAALTQPRLWLLGSSMYSARLAAAKGLPYVFAHHFSGKGTEEALELYRSRFVPSALAARPVTFLTVNAAVADTREEATALMMPNLHMMARLRTGQPLGPVQLVEEAQDARLTPEQQRIVDSGLERAVVGSPEEAAEQVRALGQRFGVDEVMVHPVASAHRGTGPATAPARVATCELLAKELF